jgi:hypothetical protein
MRWLRSCLLLVLVAGCLTAAAGCLLVGHWTDRVDVQLAGAAALAAGRILTVVGSALPGFVLAVTLADAADGSLEHTHAEGGTGRVHYPIAALGVLMLVVAVIWAATR